MNEELERLRRLLRDYGADAEMRAERDALAAVIEKARGVLTWAHLPEEGRDEALEILATVDSGVVLRERDAEKWNEGLDAGRDRWMDHREFGEKPMNPYRGGDNQ